ESCGECVGAVAWRERLRALALLGLERRLELQHVLEQVLEAAAREGREPAGRDRAWNAHRVEARLELGGQRRHEAVVGRELRRPARLGRQARLLEERRSG